MAGRFVTFDKTVTAAGTAEPLVASETRCIMVLIQAKIANTGSVFIGDVNVDSTNGIELYIPGSATPDSIQIGSPNNHDTFNLQDLWLDSGVNGEGVNVLYME